MIELEKQVDSLTKENMHWREGVLNSERYKRRWCLRIKGKRKSLLRTSEKKLLSFYAKLHRIYQQKWMKKLMLSIKWVESHKTDQKKSSFCLWDEHWETTSGEELKLPQKEFVSLKIWPQKTRKWDKHCGQKLK